MKKIKRLVLSITVFSLLLIIGVQSLSLEDLFRPFEFLDIAEIYEHYSGIVDLFIYLLIFIGTAQVTLGRRFAGRGGKAISIGTGICLAISMIIAEEKFGFSIRSFGPVAAGILVLLLGVMIYRLFHFMGMVRPGAWSVAYVTIFIAMHAVSPEFFIWLDENIPVLTIIAIMVLVLSIVGVITSLIPGGERKIFEYQLHQTQAMEPPRKREKKDLGNEVTFIKHYIKPIAKRTVKGSNAILQDLYSVGNAIKCYGHIPLARRIIIEQLGRILPREHEMQNHFQRLRSLNDQLLRLDTSLFSEKSRKQLESMKPEERALFKKELKDEINRIGIEKQAQQIEQRLTQDINGVNQYLTLAASALNAGNTDEAIQAIDDAIALEKETSDLTKRLKKLERILLSLAKRDFKLEKHMNGL